MPMLTLLLAVVYLLTIYLLLILAKHLTRLTSRSALDGSTK